MLKALEPVELPQRISEAIAVCPTVQPAQEQHEVGNFGLTELYREPNFEELVELERLPGPRRGPIFSGPARQEGRGRRGGHEVSGRMTRGCGRGDWWAT